MKNCSHPMVPNDEELLRYVLDEEPLSPEASEHVTQCSICQKRVLHYQQVNRYLLKNLYRSACPSPTMLNMYAAALSGEETQHIEEHILICPLCTQEVSEIRQVLADFDPFPEGLVISKNNRSEQVKSSSLVSAKPQLRLDESCAISGDGEEKRWHYQFSSLNILLSLSQAQAGEMALSGHLTFAHDSQLSKTLEGTSAELYILPTRRGDKSSFSEGPSRCTQVNTSGQLVFEDLSPGIYTLLLHIPMVDIVIDELTIEKKAS